MTRVRETISNLHEEGIPDEIIEYMSEHISDEEEEEESQFPSVHSQNLKRLLKRKAISWVYVV